MKLKTIIHLLLLPVLCIGCSQKGSAPFAPPAVTNSLANGYEQKVDHLLVIFDASASMDDSLPVKFALEQERSKLNTSKDTLANLEQSLKGLNLDAGLRIFGPQTQSPQGDTLLIYPLTAHNDGGLTSAVERVRANGLTSLNEPIIASITDLEGKTDQIAVLIMSDGLDENLEENKAAMRQLKQQFGDNLCVYPIVIGPSTKGRQHLEELALIGECGFVVEAKDLANPEDMADYIEKVFLEKSRSVKTVTITDHDRDGVIDSADRCPNTPYGVNVDQFGCPKLAKEVVITLDIKFEYDQDDVERQYDDELEEVADFMSKYPYTTLALKGYADNYGSEAYNMKLSQRRAEEVEQYLVEKFGIAPQRISTKGYGFADPIASNDTAEGRQKNRRVVAVISNATN